MNDSIHRFIRLGVATKPHGLKGECSLHIEEHLSDIVIDALDDLKFSKKNITLFPLTPIGQQKTSTIPREGSSYVLETVRGANKFLIKLQGVDSIEAITELIPFSLEVKRSELPYESTEPYPFDLVGLKLFTGPNELTPWGEVQEVMSNGFQLVVEVLVLQNNEIITLPWVEAFVQSVDLDNQSAIVIRPQFVE